MWKEFNRFSEDFLANAYIEEKLGVAKLQNEVKLNFRTKGIAKGILLGGNLALMNSILELLFPKL